MSILLLGLIIGFFIGFAVYSISSVEVEEDDEQGEDDDHDINGDIVIKRS